MKPVSLIHPVLIAVTCLLSVTASAQKTMMLDDSLKVNSEVFEVKTKGGSMIKFNFGPYKTIEAKAGVIKGTNETNWRFLKNDISRSTSQQQSRFTLAGDKEDTAWVKIAVKSEAKEAIEKYLSFNPGFIGIERRSILINARSTFLADISLSSDTAVWSLLIIRQTRDDIRIDYSSGIVLTNGGSEIDVREIYKWSDGKSPLMQAAIGYEFLLDGRPIAAIQAPLSTLYKKMVWLRNDLDSKMKIVIAAAAVSLMEYNFLSATQFD